MKLLFTGSTGAIGKVLLKKMIPYARQVICLSRKKQSSSHQNVSYLSCNISDSEDLNSLKDVLKDIDCVIHFAALISRKGMKYERNLFYAVNHHATLNLLDFCLNNGIRRLIYASSISVMGNANKFPIKETTPPRPQNIYALSKLFGELECEFFRYKGMVSTASLRISAPYGYNCHPDTVLPLFIKKALNSENITLYGNGSREQDFIHVDDIADLILRVLNSNFSGILNVASGFPVSMKDLAEVILRHIPESHSRIVFLPQSDPQEGQRMQISMEKACQELNFTPSIDLDAGIKRYVECLKTH